MKNKKRLDPAIFNGIVRNLDLFETFPGAMNRLTGAGFGRNIR